MSSNRNLMFYSKCELPLWQNSNIMHKHAKNFHNCNYYCQLDITSTRGEKSCRVYSHHKAYGISCPSPLLINNNISIKAKCYWQKQLLVSPRPSTGHRLLSQELYSASLKSLLSSMPMRLPRIPSLFTIDEPVGPQYW